MTKNLLFFVFLLVVLSARAQENTASPYSYYGIGEVRFRGTIENRAMAGLSVFSDSIHINLLNPAFYSHLKLTTFSVGGSYLTTNLNTNNESEKARRTTLDYLAVAFPVGKKAGVGFGLMPYSAVGYKVRTQSTFENIDIIRTYRGEGGLNKVFAGTSYRLSNTLTVGAEFQYFFGRIESTSEVESANVLEGIQYGTKETNESQAGGFGGNFGLSYCRKIKEKLTLSAAASYAPSSIIKYQNNRRLTTFQRFVAGAVTIDVDTLTVADSRIKMPNRLTLGGGIGEDKKWMVGAEAEFRDGSDLGNRFDISGDVAFAASQRITLGGYYIPQFNAFSNYLRRIVYRGGLRYETTGLVLNGKHITDAAATIGFGFPLGGNTFSNINLGLEYGKRGTRAAGLVEENYFNFSVGLSFNDRWFLRRKYD
jgi:long-subunit fatty acid transport protein